MKILAFILSSCFLLSAADAASAKEKPRCLLVSSYHPGYAWSDGVEAGVRSTLKDTCELRQFNMDTKRHKDEAAKEKAGREAHELIERWKPDVVIAADDNAAKYLIVPYYKNKSLPIVFCGINWSAKTYGFPFRNVTGMVEVAPVRALLKAAAEISGGRKALYIGADTLSEKKNLKWTQKAAAKLGITLDKRLVTNSAAWLKAYLRGQKDYAFVVIGSHAGIKDWDDERMREQVLAKSRVLSVSVMNWMMPVTMLGMTKIPAEQGEWAASVALEILKGHKASEFPVLTNRQWELWQNQRLLEKVGITLPERLKRKAKRVINLE